MPDGIRMIEVAGLSRSLEELRRNDPEQRVLAERHASAATVKHVQEIHRDVAGPENPGETRLDDPKREEGRRKGRHHPQEAAEAASREHAEPPPELAEGHILDIKV